MSHKFKILVVDDDLKNIQVGINFLKKNKDYHLVFATSGEQALDRVAEVDFDLILLDIVMPTLNGFEVCKRLKANEKTKNIPIIFLTAKHEQDSLVKGFEVGGADYITKPFNAPELNARVKTHLELHHSHKQEVAKLQKMLMCSQQAEIVKFIASGIAHDCNNFMMSIRSNIQMLQKRLTIDGLSVDNYLDFFEGVNIASKQISTLLNNFFSFSSKNKAQQEIVDIKEVIFDLNKIYKGNSSHNISFEQEVISQPALAVADKLHIEQVLLNLIFNAQHAILERPDDHNQEKGTIRLSVDSCKGEIHKDLASEDSYLKISISDNGTGIPPEIIENIFDQYFTTRAINGGTGLGLAVSMAIAKSHKGTIDVSSEVGKGTVFTLLLPQHIE